MLEFRVWWDHKSRKNAAACWPCRADQLKMSCLTFRRRLMSGLDGSQGCTEGVSWCLQLLFWEHQRGAALLCFAMRPQHYPAPAPPTSTEVLFLSFCLQSLGGETVEWGEYMRRSVQQSAGASYPSAPGSWSSLQKRRSMYFQGFITQCRGLRRAVLHGARENSSTDQWHIKIWA